MAQAKRKKRFFDVEIPLIKKDVRLQAYEVEDLNGKVINYDLTRVLRGKSLVLSSKVTVKEGKATSTPKATKLMPYFLKRMVRRGTNYVEDSFSADCKNGTLRIKPFLVTRRKVPRSIRKNLRNTAKEELTKYLSENKYENIFEDILSNKLQKTLSLKLKKIYPLSLCEIKTIKVEKEFEAKPEKNIKKSEIVEKTKEKPETSEEKPDSEKESKE